MDSQSFKKDIDTAEQIDEALQHQSVSIEDITGTMEAVNDETSKLEPIQQLTDHQQEMVNTFHDVSQAKKGPVYAVADEKALEAYVVGNEGFLDLTAGLAKKASIAFSKEIPLQFKATAKGLKHYIDLADKLRTRLLNLKPLLQSREFPYRDVFEFGPYARFFQVAGQPIDTFSAFEEAMNVQCLATQHVITASNSFATPIMEKLLQSLQALQVDKEPELERITSLRDSVKTYWENTWLEADITPKPGQTPQSIVNAFPDRKFTSLAPLLDNRFLVAHQPKSDGGQDPVRITSNIKHYGASVAFDKVKGLDGYKAMNVPNCDDLLHLVTQTVNTLYDMKGLTQLVNQNNGFADDLKKATDVLNKLMNSVSSTDKQFYGYITEYFKMATAVGQVIQQPYVSMCWLYIRCAIVVTSLVELAVVEDEHQHVVAARFFAKQNTEFSNPAMESYQTTRRVLKAAKSAHLSR